MKYQLFATSLLSKYVTLFRILEQITERYTRDIGSERKWKDIVLEATPGGRP